MALLKLNPDSQAVNNHTTLPKALSEPNKSVFTTLYPESTAASLLKYVEGYPWTVNYYGQLVNDANTLEHIDPGTPQLLQPLYKVSGMILQVSTPISSNYDEATGVTTMNGSALFPLGIIPNKGDAFIASVDSGEDAIFVINTIFRKTHRKETLYEVNYSLYKYTSTDPGTVNTLEQKTQEVYFFNKDTNYFNRDLLITKDVKEAKERLSRILVESENYYFATFAQRDAAALFIPGTEDSFYDPQLMKFITKTVAYSKLIQYPLFSYTYRDKYAQQQSFFDMFLTRNLSNIVNINQRYGFVSSAGLYNSTRFGTAYHAGVGYILYPHSPSRNLDIQRYAIKTPSDTFTTGYVTPKNYNLPTLTIQTKNNDTDFVKPVLHAMFDEDYYVVSKNFYDFLEDNSKYENISFVELMLYRFMKNQAIAREDLVILMESYPKWSLLHQMYLLPLLWVIIRNTI